MLSDDGTVKTYISRLGEAFDTPEIFNTDQRCQFISEAFTRVLRDASVKSV